MAKSLKTLAIEHVLKVGNLASYSEIINFLLTMRKDVPAGTDINKDRKYRGMYSFCLSKPYNLEDFKDEHGRVKKMLLYVRWIFQTAFQKRTSIF